MADKPLDGAGTSAEEPLDDPVTFLSAHVKRYDGVSAEGLRSFIAVFNKHFKSGSQISQDGLMWLSDLIESLADLYVTSKAANKSLKTERDKLSKEVAGLLCQMEKSNITIPPSDISQEFQEAKEDMNKNAWDLPNVQHINLSKLVKKPRYFDGDDPMPREWIEEYQDAMEDNFWSEQTAIYYFKHFLKKDAATWFKLSVRPRINKDWKWKDLFSLFEANFLGRAEKDRIKRLLRELRMKPEDRSATFIPRVRQYLLMLSPEMNEADQVSNITEKLRAEYATAVVDGDPDTVDELRDICRKVEAAHDLKKAAYASASTKSSDQSNKFKSKRPFIAFQNTKTTGNNVKAPTNNKSAPTSKLSCHRCGRNNHFIRDCRATTKIDGTKLGPKTSIPKAKVNAVVAKQKTNTETKHDESDSEVEITINTIIANTKTNGQPSNWLSIPLICNDVTCSAVLDSGAQRSVVSEELVKQHGWKVDKQMTVRLSGPNNSPLEVVGSVVIDTRLTINNITKRKKCRWVVARGLATPMLMGADIIIDFHIITDLRKKRIAFFAKQGFRTISDTVVPAKTQQIIPVTVDADGLVMTVNLNRGDHLEIANSVGIAENNQTKILLLNGTDKPIKLSKETKMADVEVLEAEEEDTPRKNVKGVLINAVLPLPNSEQIVKVGDDLNAQQLEELRQVLFKYSQAFSLRGELGCAKGVQHKIEIVKGAKPIVEPARRLPQLHIDETSKQVKDMLDKGIIQESFSPWASAYVVVKKKTGDFRVCVDFRRLNALTKKDSFPLPNAEACIESLAGQEFFSSFDFASGYWQMEVEPQSRELTAFRTEHGHYEFTRMPFGLCNAPASFQRLMNKTFASLRGLNLQIYLDDVCLASTTWQEHLAAIEELLAVIERSNIKLNASKCTLAAKRINFLGHIISKSGVQQDPSKLAAIVNMPRPTNLHEVRRILGMLNYYRRFVPNFAVLATPLSNLTRKQTPFRWEEAEEAAFNALVGALSENALLAHFNTTDDIMLKTDASLAGVGAILMQKQNDEWRIVCCHSRKLNDAERNYGITDLEALAVVDAMQKFRPYLLGRHFKLVTDHSALSVLEQKNAKSARVRRWQILLSEFDSQVSYMKGSLHVDVDCLSRAPIQDSNDYLLDSKICTILIPIDVNSWTYESEEDLQLLDKAVREQGNLLVRDDILYKQNKLYVPTSRRQETMREAHDTARGGHGGQQVTLAKLQQFWWPTIVKDVIDYVKSCLPCQTRKAERALPIGGMQHFEAYSPFDLVSIDTLGPLPESLNGYRYVIVAIDYFTKFIEARAVKDLKAQDCASFVLDFCGRYGPPKRVVTDNGPQFLNDLVRDTMKVFGVTQRWSTADHSQGNAPAERAIQTLQEKLSLSNLSRQELDSWDSIIPTIVLAMNTSLCKSTGYSPFEMLFGRQPEIFDNLVSRQATPKDLHTQLIKNRLDTMWSRAITNQNVSNNASRNYFGLTHREREFKVDDLVLMRDPNRRKGKLDPRFQGPFRVVAVKSKDVYEIQKVDTGIKLIRHSASLKPYHARTQQQEASGQPEANASRPAPRRVQDAREQPTRRQPTRRQPPRASAQRGNIHWLIVALVMTSTLCPTAHGVAFQREPNLMWLWKDVTVFGKYIEYDVCSIIKTPCASLQTETNKYNHTKMEIQYEHGPRMESIALHLAMQNKCDSYNRNIFDQSLDRLLEMCKHVTVPNEGESVYARSLARVSRNLASIRKNRNFISEVRSPGNVYEKRGWTSTLVGAVAGGFSGVVVMDLVSTVWDFINPNSDYNRINRIEADLDRIEAKHEGELNAFRNVTRQVVNTFNGTVSAIKDMKNDIHQLVTDLPEYIFGASYILEYIQQGARLLDQIASNCNEMVNVAALSEFLQIPELKNIDPRNTKWISITSSRVNTIRFRFRVSTKSVDTSVQAVEAFDVWDFSKKPFALRRYTGAKMMIHNSTSDCSRAIDVPDKHMVMERCTKKNYVDPELKKWTTIRTATHIREEKQVTQVKNAGSTVWIYCPFGNITVDSRSVPCPYHVFSLPAGIAFSTSDYDMPAADIIKTKQSKNVDMRLAAHFIHAMDVSEFDLVDSLARLEEATNLEAITPIHRPENSSQWFSLFLTIIFFHLLGMATLFTYQYWRVRNGSGGGSGASSTAPAFQMTIVPPPRSS